MTLWSSVSCRPLHSSKVPPPPAMPSLDKRSLGLTSLLSRVVALVLALESAEGGNLAGPLARAKVAVVTGITSSARSRLSIFRRSRPVGVSGCFNFAAAKKAVARAFAILEERSKLGANRSISECAPAGEGVVLMLRILQLLDQ